MSKNNPIPVGLREEFKAYMEASENDDLPDGAWFAVLEDAAGWFMKQHKIKHGDAHDAAHQYIRMCVS